MKQFLQPLLDGTSLSRHAAQEAMWQIGRGEWTEASIAAFLMGIQTKGVAVEEIIGFREAMLSLATPVPLAEFDAMDVCGTGGDGKDTFNISTTAAFVVAGAGQNVAKHGNHGVSSAVGSSTVLEYLGVPFTNDGDALRRKLETAGIVYLHAPLFHPAMRFVAPVRKALGIKTVFNLLGPLLNPARVQKQLTGVYSPTIFDLYQGVFAESPGFNGIVWSVDGYDEISLTGDFWVGQYGEKQVHSPTVLGLPMVQELDLYGGASVEESAKILHQILKNEGSIAQESAVLANAALALSIARSIPLDEALAQARESLRSGKALLAFDRLISN